MTTRRSGRGDGRKGFELAADAGEGGRRGSREGGGDLNSVGGVNDDGLDLSIVDLRLSLWRSLNCDHLILGFVSHDRLNLSPSSSPRRADSNTAEAHRERLVLDEMFVSGVRWRSKGRVSGTLES